MEEEINPQKLIEKIKKIYQDIKIERPDLFINDIHELNLVHHFSNKLSNNLPGYYVDIEYNHLTDQFLNNKKTFKSNDNDYFRTDLIVHLPYTQFANLLAMEFSKGGDMSRERNKLTELTDQNKRYKYKIGILFDIKTDTWEYYINGKKLDYKSTLIKLNEYKTKAEKLRHSLYNLNTKYNEFDEKIREIEYIINNAQSSNNTYQWDLASNQMESLIINRNEEINSEIIDFEQNFKEYLKSVFIPSYGELLDIIETLNNLIIKNIDNLQLYIESPSLFDYPHESFKYIYLSFLYCYESLSLNKKGAENALKELKEMSYFINDDFLDLFN